MFQSNIDLQLCDRMLTSMGNKARHYYGKSRGMKDSPVQINVFSVQEMLQKTKPLYNCDNNTSLPVCCHNNSPILGWYKLYTIWRRWGERPATMETAWEPIDVLACLAVFSALESFLSPLSKPLLFCTQDVQITTWPTWESLGTKEKYKQWETKKVIGRENNPLKL